MGNPLVVTLAAGAIAFLAISSAEAHDASGSERRSKAHRHGPAPLSELAAGTALRGAKDPDHGHAGARTRINHQHGTGHRDESGGKRSESDHQHGIETENLFGFTLGSDTEEAGARGAALENILRVGKRAGTYHGLAQKLEYSFGVTNDLSLSFALLADYHQVRNVPGFDDVRGRYAFNGFGAELRYRLLDRKTSPFGLTLHVEPSIARIDEVSGQAGRKLGSENKIIFDQELVPDTLFGAVNFIYDIERMRERREDVVERAATVGITGALAYKITDDLFVGSEARYLRAYEGFALDRWRGHAVYIGPTLHARIMEKGWISLAWNAQVAGREALNRRERAEVLAEYGEAVEAAVAAGEPVPPVPVFRRRGPRDLVNFEAHQFRVKVGFEF